MPLPSAPVELTRDDQGITHVYAQNDRDAFFGGGYAMARDRLFQMELVRRRALGTQAEVLGEAAHVSDRASRPFRFGALGAADYERLRREAPEDAALFDAWTAGINSRIDDIHSGKAPLPYGFRKTELDFDPPRWQTSDIFAIAKVLAFGLSRSFDKDILATLLLRLAPDAVSRLPIIMPAYDTFTTPVQASTLPPPPPPPASQRGRKKDVPLDALAWQWPWSDLTFASNNWAVDGRFTESGRPMLAGDPHQQITNPSVLWPVHLSSTEGNGSLDVYGFAFPGSAAVQLGFNRHIAWTATTSEADATDIWDVVVSDDFATAFIGAESVPVVARDELIQVRGEGQPAGQGTKDHFVVHEVPGYGVFLPDEALPVPRLFIADHQLLVNWTGFAATSEASAFLGFDRARSTAEFEKAGKQLQVGMENFLVADAKGYLFTVPGLVPDRGGPGPQTKPWHVLDGSDPATYWNGRFLPDEKLPRLENPERGFIGTANNDPFGFIRDGNVENDPWYFGAFFANGLRASRIDAELSRLVGGTRKLTPEDMEALQADVHSPMADSLIPALAEALAAIETDATLAQWRGRDDLLALGARLVAWDRRMDRDKGEPAAFAGLEWFTAKQAFSNEVTSTLFEAIGTASPPFWMGMLRNTVDHRYPAADSFMPRGRHALMLESLDATEGWLKERFGTDDVTRFAWRDVHGALFKNVWKTDPVTLPRVAVHGGPDTLNVSPAPFFKDGKPLHDFSSIEASAYRFVFSFGDDGVPVARLNFELGADGEPGAPFSANRQDEWLDVRYSPVRYLRSDVAAHTSEKISLPRGR